MATLHPTSNTWCPDSKTQSCSCKINRPSVLSNIYQRTIKWTRVSCRMISAQWSRECYRIGAKGVEFHLGFSSTCLNSKNKMRWMTCSAIQRLYMLAMMVRVRLPTRNSRRRMIHHPVVIRTPSIPWSKESVTSWHTQIFTLVIRARRTKNFSNNWLSTISRSHLWDSKMLAQRRMKSLDLPIDINDSTKKCSNKTTTTMKHHRRTRCKTSLILHCFITTSHLLTRTTKIHPTLNLPFPLNTSRQSQESHLSPQSITTPSSWSQQ